MGQGKVNSTEKMKKSPADIAQEIMYTNDEFSKHLGMHIVSIAEGECVVSMVVRDFMANGFKIAHGGITYSLADSTFAFACNSLGHVAVSVETSISHMKKVVAGDELTASGKMIQRSKSLGRFEVKVTNQKDDLVADFKGTCFFTDKEY